MRNRKEYDKGRYLENKGTIIHRSTKLRKKNRQELNLGHWKKLAYYYKLNGEELQKQFLKQDKKCFYCKVAFDKKIAPSVEHYFPRNNSRVVISCMDCNRLKWNRNGDN